MTQPLAIPQARIPIGWATIAGQRLPVLIDIEWMRYLITLTERAGGVIGDSTTDLSASAFDDAGTEEMEAGMYALADAIGQMIQPADAVIDDRTLMLPIAEPMPSDPDLLADLAALRAEVDVLRSQIDGLKQGAQL